MLVRITPEAFNVDIDIVYATSRNFTGKAVYKNPHCFLHQDAIPPLEEAIRLAKHLGLRLKIFDAFRPHEAQMALWNHTPDPDFLSHPETGSMPHCRGVAVDLTLLDATGNALDMGTEFDAFLPASHHGVIEGISETAQHNRLILLGIMTSAGWDFYRNEWWHYQLFKPREYALLKDSECGTDMI
jgi:zinc D-Ala-D-Ala dipeptidase